MRICAGAISVCVLAGGVYESYTALRDALFPAKSAIARSIRSQLPYPDEAPDVSRLFAMVDGDIGANGLWFGQVAIGKEWVLGDEASYIPRIRGIFTKDETHRYRSGGRTQTSRILQLILVDDRWQVQITGFSAAQDLYAAADCLRLRIPDAVRGDNDQYMDFIAKDEDARERFLREFRIRLEQRKLQTGTRAAAQSDFVLRQTDGVNTSRVTTERIAAQLDACAGQSVSFALSPTKPLADEDGGFERMECFGMPDGFHLVLIFRSETRGYGGYSHPVTREEALEALYALLQRRTLPDYTGWKPVQRLTESRMRNK